MDQELYTELLVVDSQWMLLHQWMDAAAAVAGQTLCLQMAALFCVKWYHGHHLESVTSNQKSHSDTQ